MRETKLDIHQTVTDAIIRVLEAGVGTATLPWHRTGAASILPRNADTGKAYNGINVVMLWATAAERGYTTSLWGTYKQWQAQGAQVRKGEKAALVVFYKQYETDPCPNDAEDDGVRRVARASWVFNVDQVEGYVSPSPPLPPLGPIDRLARAEAFIRATGADIRVGGESAYYRPSEDYIAMPAEYRFRASGSQRTEDWYSVLFHELTHWSGAEHRLKRLLPARFGSPVYAIEELVAEFGASFLCAELGISAVPRPDHACYIANWLKALKEDNRAVFTAAARASEAAKYLTGLAPKPLEVPHAA